MMRYGFLPAFVGSMLLAGAGSAAAARPDTLSPKNNPPVSRPAMTLPAVTIPNYNTPRNTMRSLIAAVKAADVPEIRACLNVSNPTEASAIDAVADLLAAKERFTKTALAKLGPPPAFAGGSLRTVDSQMDALESQLPKALVTINGSAATLHFFPVQSPGGHQVQLLYFQKIGVRWKLDADRLFHLKQPGLTVGDIQFRAKVTHLIAGVLRTTTGDIASGKVKDWKSLEQDLQSRMLPVEISVVDHARREKKQLPASRKTSLRPALPPHPSQ